MELPGSMRSFTSSPSSSPTTTCGSRCGMTSPSSAEPGWTPWTTSPACSAKPSASSRSCRPSPGCCSASAIRCAWWTSSEMPAPDPAPDHGGAIAEPSASPSPSVTPAGAGTSNPHGRRGCVAAIVPAAVAAAGALEPGDGAGPQPARHEPARWQPAVPDLPDRRSRRRPVGRRPLLRDVADGAAAAARGREQRGRRGRRRGGGCRRRRKARRTG